MKIIDLLLALLTMSLWGLNFAVAKLAMTEFPPILLAALRFALVLGLLHFPMVFSGLKLLDASTASIVLQLQVPFGVIMATVLLGERLTWLHGLGMAIAFAGVALIAGAPRLGANRTGLFFLIVAALAWGYSTVQLKKIGPIDPLALNGWLGLFLAIELAIISLVLEGAPMAHIAQAGWRGWSGVLYTGIISTIVAFGLWARLVARYSVGQAMPFMLTVPVFAIIGGVVLNHDRITPDIVGGGLLTIAGVGLIVPWKPRGDDHATVANPS